MVHVVAVAYYPAYFARVLSALRGLERAFERAGRETRVQLVLNNRELCPSAQPNGRSGRKHTTGALPYPHIEHDNVGHEFGAYQRGLRAIEPLLAARDVVLFLNDTFCTHHVFSPILERNFVSVAAAAEHVAHPLVAGPVDTCARSFVLRGMRLHRWVSTWAFALNVRALEGLGFELYTPELASDIAGGDEPSRFFAPRVEDTLRDHLSVWLFDRGANVAWYGAEPLNPDNAARMAEKARSILQEKYLSARLDALSAEFRDVRPYGWKQTVPHRLFAEGAKVLSVVQGRS
jgi:hypothetical protein